MKKYTIPENFHISHVFPKFHKNKKELCFDFEFLSNCKYNIGKHNQDTNKLYGLSFGLIHNTTTLWGRIFKSQANSFRIGWNCEFQNGKIQLFAYYYNKGERTIKYLTEIELNKIYSCTLYFDRINNNVIVDINSTGFNHNSVHPFDFKNVKRWGFELFPFFGGENHAPHKMSFYIQQYN